MKWPMQWPMKWPMKWAIYLHSPNIFVGAGLTGPDWKMYRKIRKRIDEYCIHWIVNEKKMKEIIELFNETNCVGFDTSIPLAKRVVKYLRHKLIDSSITVFLRLMHLIDAMMKNCGIRAHILFGRFIFLRTIKCMAIRYKRNPKPSYQQAANYSFTCITNWTMVLQERKDIFPYYSLYLEKLKLYPFEMDPLIEPVTPFETIPLVMDPAYSPSLPSRQSKARSVLLANVHEMNELRCDDGSIVESIQTSNSFPVPTLSVRYLSTSYSQQRKSYSTSLGLQRVSDSRIRTASEKKKAEEMEEIKNIVEQEERPMSSPGYDGEEEKSENSYSDSDIDKGEEKEQQKEREGPDDTRHLSRIVSDNQALCDGKTEADESGSDDIPSSIIPKEQQKKISIEFQPIVSSKVRPVSQKILEYLAATNSSKNSSSSAFEKPSSFLIPDTHRSFSEEGIQIKFYGNQRVVLSKDDNEDK